MNEMVTESTLIRLRQMPDGEAAVALDSRLRSLEEAWKRSFIEKGVILHEVKQRLLWAKLDDPETGEPYTSFDRWVLRSAPQSRSDCYAALKAVEELRDIPRHQLEQVPRCNISILQALSSQVRQNEEVIQWATSTSQKDFVARIEYAYPEQHIESRRLLHLNPVASARPIIDKGFRLVMEHEGLTTREQVLEYWAVKSIQEYETAEAETA